MSTKIKTPDGWKTTSGGTGGDSRPDWENAVDIRAALGTAAGYTCPGPGIIICHGRPAITGSYCILRVNEICVGYDFVGGSEWSLDVNCPVSQDDVVTHVLFTDLSPVALYEPNNLADEHRYNYLFVPYK